MIDRPPTESQRFTLYGRPGGLPLSEPAAFRPVGPTYMGKARVERIDQEKMGDIWGKERFLPYSVATGGY